MKITDVILPKNKFTKLAITNVYINEHLVEFILNDSIYEAQYKTYPRQELVYKLIDLYNLSIHPDEQSNIIAQIYKSQLSNWSQLLQTISLFGWFISGVETDIDEYFKGNEINQFTSSKFNRALLIIEPLHSDEVKTPPILYHATPLSVWTDKIQKLGLSPKTKSIQSTHPERVYFTTTVELAIQMANLIADARMNNTQQSNNKFDVGEYYKNWAILKIDTSKIPHTKYLSYFKVHKDLNTDEQRPHFSLYSNNYVPPAAINLVKTITI